jgi:hypothetical protein
MLYLVKGQQTGLQGPFSLSFEVVDREVPRHVPGVYVVGYVDPDGWFRIENVGRSDDDLRGALDARIGTASHFKFLAMPTADQAFARECQIFHDFKPPGTRCHPEPPADSDRDCPRCFFPFGG